MEQLCWRVRAAQYMLATPLYQYGQAGNVQITCMVLASRMVVSPNNPGRMGDMGPAGIHFIPWGGISLFVYADAGQGQSNANSSPVGLAYSMRIYRLGGNFEDKKVKCARGRPLPDRSFPNRSCAHRSSAVSIYNLSYAAVVV